MSAGLSSSKSY